MSGRLHEQGGEAVLDDEPRSGVDTGVRQCFYQKMVTVIPLLAAEKYEYEIETQPFRDSANLPLINRAKDSLFRRLFFLTHFPIFFS